MKYTNRGRRRMCVHEWDRAVERHRRRRKVLEHVRIVQAVRLIEECVLTRCGR